MKKSKGRYRLIEQKSTEKRKYVSYEDEPLKESEDKDPVPQNLTKKFLKVFLILFVSVVAVLALINIDNLTPEKISHWFQYDLLGKTEGTGYPTKFSGINVDPGNFELIDVLPVYCSDTSVVVLNSNAGEYQNNQHSFANPILKVNSRCGIIYNSDANGFRIIDRDGTVYNGSAERKIFDADISENGCYGILSYGVDYLSNFDLYKKDQTKKYSYSFADYYVNRVSLNNNGTQAALTGVSAKNGGLISAIYILDVNQEQYLQKYEVEDDYIYDIKYMDNGNVFAVGKFGTYFIDVASGTKKDISYNSSTLTSYRIKPGRGLLLSLSNNPDGRDCDIRFIGKDGNIESDFNTNSKIISLDIHDDKIAALTNGSITVYGKKGNTLNNTQISADVRKLCMMDGNTVYVIGKSEINKILINY